MLGKELQVIDIKTAKLFWVDSAFVTKALRDFPRLAQKFKDEKASLDAVQLEYLQLANEAER